MIWEIDNTLQSATNFGLINQTYTNQSDAGLTQWQAFAAEMDRLNAGAAKGTSYKLLFMARHAEGYHNAAESHYGTPAWNCYWSVLNGNDTAHWNDAHLTPVGIESAEQANAYWKSRIAVEKITTPEQYYTSPMARCLETAEITFGDIDLPASKPFIPTVKEYLREGISLHTCNHRSNKTWIQENYPTYKIEDGFPEYDELYNGITSETQAAQDVRSRRVLEEILGCKSAKSVISITSHSGEISSLLRVLGHQPFRLATGSIIPVLVKVDRLATSPTTTATASYTTSGHCTVPPVTSIANTGCLCPNSAAPITDRLVTVTPVVEPFSLFTPTAAACPKNTACKKH
jgi:broad specificity phosphatase PhoE